MTDPRPDKNIEDSKVTTERAGVEYSRSELYNEYWVKKKSKSQIARESGTSLGSVTRALDDLGIPSKDQETAQSHINQKKKKNRPYHDESILEEMYVDQKMATTEIANEFDVSRETIVNHLKKNGFDLRNSPYEIPQFSLIRRTRGAGKYPMFYGCDGREIPVHQLLIIAQGADPHEIFGDSDMSVDHINRHPADNRPSNLRLMSLSEHGRKEAEMNRDLMQAEYSERDIRFVIKAMLNPQMILDLDG